MAKKLSRRNKKASFFKIDLLLYSILLEVRLNGAAEQVYMGNPRPNNYGFLHYNCRGV